MSTIYFYDDADARRFEPFALTRPVAALRVGARLIRERWEVAVGKSSAGFVSSAHLRDFEESDAPRHADHAIPAGALLVNARFAPRLARITRDADVLECEGRVAAVRLTDPLALDALTDGSLGLDTLAVGRSRAPIDGWWIDAVWDLVADLEERLRDDLERLTADRRPAAPAQCAVLGGAQVYVDATAVVEPFVTFDCAHGPVVIEAGATVQSFTRVQGPVWIGAHSIVGGDKITACAIGEHCKVHGEMSASVLVGYANKAHDGFVGQSYLGRWVNLGANTVTSNLKNTYGAVSLWTPDGVRNTGQQFLGTLFGDHAKTGIGMTLTTGSVVGAGAQVFGGAMQPKVVPPFAWGTAPPYDSFDLERFLVVAERVMARRKVELGDRGRSHLRRAYAARWSAGA